MNPVDIRRRSVLELQLGPRPPRRGNHLRLIIMPEPVYVKEIWRYPVKSMAGKRLERAEITALAITNDRAVLAVNPRGRPNSRVTSRHLENKPLIMQTVSRK